MINKDNIFADKLTLSTGTDFTAIDLDEPKHQEYFKGGHWGQSLELLQHLCQYSENIVLVVGEAGLGKTTLKKALLANTKDIFKCCNLEAENYDDVNDLINDVAVGFGIANNNSKLELRENIAALSARDDKVWVLLVDNAHLLDPDSLDELIKLAELTNKTKNEGNCKLKLVLLGLAGLEEKVANPHVLELEPLTLAEVAQYLQFKWRFVGNKTELPFDNVTIKKIHQLSAGNPKEIERLAREQLAGVKLGAREIKNKKTRLPKIAFAALFKATLIVGCLSGVAIFLLKPLLIGSKDVPLVKIEMATEKLAVVDPKGIAIEVMPTAPPLPTETIVELTTTAAVPAQAVQPIATTTNVAAAAPEEVLPRVLELELLAKQNLLQEKKAKAKPAVSVLPVAAEKAKQEQPVIANKTGTNKYSKAEQKILQLPSNHYTIQLLGASKIAGIEQFISSNKLQKQAYYYSSPHNKQPWYILVFGNYNTREQAKVAIAQLPAAVRALQPWVRDVASIKQVLQARN